MSDLAIVLRSLNARRFSTAVTVLTVAIAVALLLTLLSLRAQGSRAFLRGSGNAHLLVSADAGPLVSVLNAIFYANAPQRPIMPPKLAAIRDSFPWEWVIPIQQGDSYRGFPTLATTPEFFSRFEPVDGEPWRFAQGRAFGADFEAVLGAAVARETGLAPGAKLVFTHGAGGEGGHVHDEFAFTVVGVLEPTGSAHDRAVFCNLESAWILHAHDRREREGLVHHDHHDHDDHADHADHDDHDGHEAGEDHDHDGDHEAPTTSADLIEDDKKVTGILLRVPTRPGSSVSAALQQQFDALRRDPSITVANPADQIGKLLSIVGRVDLLFVAMAVAILLGSAVSILVALYNSMYERRRQTAIFRVLGCSRFRIMALVLTESALIGAMGAALGIAVSTLGTAAAATYLRSQVGLVLGVAVEPRSAVLVAASTVALAALAGVLPAVLAYRTPVAENLRPAA
ncbi:MAG: ABC transporter permease [Phycisphaerales bacterium]